jgi:transposase-like protein
MRALDLFKGRHFDREIIVLCVRWYLRYKLSSRDLVQMMAERGTAGCCGSATLLQQGNEEARHTAGHYTRCVRGFASSHHGIAISGNDSAPCRDTICKYLNNVVEQDHRRIKQRVRPMLGFKRFDTATITISGIELAEKIRKQRFKIGTLPGRPVVAPDIWAAVLAA